MYIYFQEQGKEVYYHTDYIKEAEKFCICIVYVSDFSEIKYGKVKQLPKQQAIDLYNMFPDTK